MIGKITHEVLTTPLSDNNELVNKDIDEESESELNELKVIVSFQTTKEKWEGNTALLALQTMLVVLTLTILKEFLRLCMFFPLMLKQGENGCLVKRHRRISHWIP